MDTADSQPELAEVEIAPHYFLRDDFVLSVKVSDIALCDGIVVVMPWGEKRRLQL